MSMKQFKKVFQNIPHGPYRSGASNAWMRCTEWILEKAQENITLIDFMNEIAKEAGRAPVVAQKVKLPAGFDLVDGCRPLCHSLCSRERRRECYEANNPLSIEPCENEKNYEDAVSDAKPLEILADQDREAGLQDLIPVRKWDDCVVDNSTPEENKVENGAKDCKNVDTCIRGCKLIKTGTPPEPRPMWFSPVNDRACWVPCHDYEDKNKKGDEI